MRLGERRAANTQRQSHVFERTEFRQQVMELVNESKVPVAQATQLGFAEARERIAGNADLTRAGMVQTAQQVHQGGFTGAGSTQDGMALTACHLEVNPPQYLDIEFALAKTLVHVDRLDDGCRSGLLGSHS